MFKRKSARAPAMLNGAVEMNECSGNNNNTLSVIGCGPTNPKKVEIRRETSSSLNCSENLIMTTSMISHVEVEPSLTTIGGQFEDAGGGFRETGEETVCGMKGDPDMISCPGSQGYQVSFQLVRNLGRTARIVILCLTILLVVIATRNGLKSTKPHQQNWGCTGGQIMAQTAYCSHDFAIKVEIDALFDSNGSMDPILRVHILKIYKDLSDTFRVRRKAHIKYYRGAIYSHKFEVKKSYLLTGFISEKARGAERRYINFCSFTMPWINITHLQKRGFKSHYKQNCNRCKIEHNDEKHTTKSCFLNYHDRIEYNCRNSNSVCRYDRVYNVCAFDRLSDYSTCKHKANSNSDIEEKR